jgi:basic membrane lipoprotein Med (substrate-binding protein (PBP1-ABC) superfamily)
MISDYTQYLSLVGEQSSDNLYAIGEQFDEDAVSVSSDNNEAQYLYIDSEDEDEYEIYPAEQIIAKQLHWFFVNNQEFINRIYEFIDIYNEFVGNP